MTTNLINSEKGNSSTQDNEKPGASTNPPQLRETSINIPDVDLQEEEDRIKIYDSLEEFNKNLPETVTLLEAPNGSVCYLVGTAHFSEKSQDDVSQVRS